LKEITSLFARPLFIDLKQRGRHVVGLVEYSNVRDAQLLIEGMDKGFIDGQVVELELAGNRRD
jgi:hypothetical protein